MDDAYEKINKRVEEYNCFRPHSSLNDLTPEQMIDKHIRETGEDNCLPAATNDEQMFFLATEYTSAESEKTSIRH